MTKVKDEEEDEGEFTLAPSKVNPESEWECLQEGYREKVLARAKANPLVIF